MKALTRGIHGRLRSFGFAYQGIATMLRTQANARLHLLVSGVVVLAGWLLSVSRLEWCALLLAIAAVWVAEGFNTAIEFLTDLASPGVHPLAKHAKDVAAGAVLLAAAGASLVGVIVFAPHASALLLD
jgi:diacylglycerol kinase (ATP)